MFDDDKNIERDKTFNDFYNIKFRITKNETFEIFIIRFIVVITFLIFENVTLIISFRQKLIKRFNENIKYLIFCKFYKNFVDDVRVVNFLNCHNVRRLDYIDFN